MKNWWSENALLTIRSVWNFLNLIFSPKYEIAENWRPICNDFRVPPIQIGLNFGKIYPFLSENHKKWVLDPLISVHLCRTKCYLCLQCKNVCPLKKIVWKKWYFFVFSHIMATWSFMSIPGPSNVIGSGPKFARDLFRRYRKKFRPGREKIITSIK